MKKKNIWILPFLAVAVGLLLYLYSFTITDAQQLYLTVTPEDAAGWEITGFQNGVEVPITAEEAVNGSGTAVLRRVVPDEWSNYGTAVVTDCREMCVFIDDKLVYSNVPMPIEAVGELPEAILPENALFSQVFAVNPVWSGKTMTVLTRTFTGESFASISFDLLSSTVTAEQQNAWASKQAIPGAAFGILFLLLFGLFLYRLSSVKKALPLLLLAVAALLQMISYLDKLNTVSSLSTFDVAIQALYILLPLLYAGMQMKKERKLFLFISIPVWAVYFASVAAWSVFSLSVPMWFDKLAYLTLLLPVILIGFSMKIARMGNPYFKRMLKAMGVFALGLAGILTLSALINRSLFELFVIYWKETVAGYPFPLAFILFTALLIIEFLLAAVELLESRVRTAQEIEALKLRNELTAQSLSSMEHTNEALAMVRHDELHHLRTLSALCRENPAGAGEYAASLAKELEAIPTMRFTENRLVNSILSIQSLGATRADVCFEAKAKLPEPLPLPERELSTVLMNLLENAIEAAAKAPEGKERKVSVLLEIEDDMLLVTIINSMPEDFDQDFFRGHFSQSTKADISQHGYGIRSARNIVSRHGGKLRYSVGDDTITLNTVMMLETAEKTVALV